MPAWDKIEQLTKHFEDMFNATGEPIEGALDQKYNWHNKLWSSLGYRRAHVQVVDNRDTHGIYILHTTVFPQVNDPSPIFGFDAVCGKNKISGAFHDFSWSGDKDSSMYLWFKDQSQGLEWNRPRELPEWAKQIFSPAMVAAGNLREESEIDQLCNLAKTTLDFYLENVGKDQQSGFNYHMAQNRYCHYQKQNPHVVRSMVAMGVPEQTMIEFVDEVLFPEVQEISIV
jgi:Ferredoxin-dependent bilin reductase